MNRYTLGLLAGCIVMAIGQICHAALGPGIVTVLITLLINLPILIGGSVLSERMLQ